MSEFQLLLRSLLDQRSLLTTLIAPLQSRFGSVLLTEDVSACQELSCRLELMRFLLHAASLSLFTDQVVALWQALLVRPTAADRSIGASLLLPFVDEGEFLNVDSRRLLLETLFPQMNLAELTVSCYTLFQRLFCTVNRDTRRLEHATANDTSLLTVAAFDLIGFETLWKIALQSIDNEVADLAFRLLFVLLTQVRKTERKTEKRRRQCFSVFPFALSSCLLHLFRNVDNIMLDIFNM
jgi:ubiquitin carboxyl-terminal hydrolase 9/24